MAERHNTVCFFDLSSPRITAYDIHEWIFAVLRIPEHTAKMIQIDGIKRHVYIKLADTESVLALLRDTAGQAQYKYPSGELSIVNITLAGLGTKRVRIANLAPEVSNDTPRATLAPYGKIVDIQNKRWSKTQICSGQRRPARDDGFVPTYPYQLTVAGQRALLSYEGQPDTCYGCGETGHMYQRCPARRKLGSAMTIATAATYSSIVTDSTAMQEEPTEVTVTGVATMTTKGLRPQQ
jgi:hypothetical protein